MTKAIAKKKVTKKTVKKAVSNNKAQQVNDNNKVVKHIAPRVQVEPEDMPVVDQMFYVFFGKAKNEKKAEIRHRLGAAWGFVQGAVAPIGSYGLAHHGVPKAGLVSPHMVLLIGLLMYSAPTVFLYMRKTVGHYRSWKGAIMPFGYVLGLEGLLTVPSLDIVYLQVMSFVALGILVFINAVESGCKLVFAKPVKRV